MSGRSYVGIDNTDKNEWIAVLWRDGKSVFSRPCKNSTQELEALARFITERCDRPKICLNPSHTNAFELVKYLGAIAGVEVVLIALIGGNAELQAGLPPLDGAEIERLQGSRELILDELARLQLRMEVLQKLLLNQGGYKRASSRSIGDSVNETP